MDLIRIAIGAVNIIRLTAALGTTFRESQKYTNVKFLIFRTYL